MNLAPNGNPSNLTPEQYKLVRTPEFKAWFGDWEKEPVNASKVVDENAEPLVVYHGSKVVNIQIFNTKLGTKTKSKMQLLFGTHFAQSIVDAEIYAKEKGKIYETFLSIKNPIDLSVGYVNRDDKNFQNYYSLVNDLKLDKKNKNVFDYDLFTDSGDYGGKSKYIQRIFITQNQLDQLSPKNVRDSLIKNNFDGVIYTPYQPIGLNQISNFSKSFIALYPEQIKLADGSNTTFDANNPDIRFSLGGEIERYIEQGVLELNFYPTNSEHAKEHNINAKNPLYIQNLKVKESERLKFIGKKVLLYLDEYAQKNGHDVIFGYISQKATMTKDNRTGYFTVFTDIDYIKHWLFRNGYAVNSEDNDFHKVIQKNPDIRFDEGGQIIINPTEIECHKCHWHWKVKHGGDDLFICHKCNYDNSKFYKFDGLQGQKILDTNSYKKGGRTIAQTPAPKKDQIKGSDKNKEGSSKDLTSAKKIELSDSTNEAIKNKVDKHNEKHPKKKITIDSAKAVVRRGMGAYSSTHRPTISGGNENSRVAWGLARLNAFTYKIINGKSKSGKYSQDDDLINELGYKVAKYEIGGQVEKMKDLFLQNGFTEDELQIIVEENPNYFNQIEFQDNKTLIVYRALELPRKLADKFIKLNKKEIGEGIGEYWTFDKNLQNAIWGDGQYEEETYIIQCKGHLDISDIDWEMMKYAYDDDIYHFSQESEIRGVNGGNSIKVVDCEELYSNGGDIQAYEQAMGISEFDEGGEIKSKKVYVSIRLDNTFEKIPNTFNEYFTKYAERTFEELRNGVLKGLVGVSSSPNNIAEWFLHRDCLIVMDYEQFIAINKTETINYYDPYQLMKNNLYLFRRLYANVSRRGEQKDAIIQTLKKILEKIVSEINLEMNLSGGQKYSELYRISRFLSPYETSAFPNWIEKNEIKIESPIDLTNAILDFNKLNDNWLGQGFENPVLTFDELLPIVEKGITNASKIYESEHEIVLINRELNIPKKSQLFFIAKDEVGQNRDSNRDELIQKYNLKELYKVYFVDRKEIQKYRDFWVKKEEEKFKNIIEKGREDLELKKEQVLDELLNYFLEKSISYIKNELEQEILDYSESLEYYDETDDNSIEQNLFSIPLVVSIMNTYELIIKNFWKSFIQKKEVKNLDIYAFDMFYFNVESELKRYFENNKDELEKLNNYRNTRGSGSLDPYKFERLLLKTINDYEKLPELVDYKELAKMYLDKMGREIYRYYDKNDLKLVSQYKDGGETDEPTHFWGDEAGGVLVYCSTTERYLILLRSGWVTEPNTWGIISGKLDDEENVQEAVLREAEEETGHKLGHLIPSFVFEKPNFKFHNFVSIVDEEFVPELNWENVNYKWVKLDEMPDNLHFGLKLLLQKEDIQTLVEKNKNNAMNKYNPKDEVIFNIPLLIRFSELMREEIKTDVALHEIVENLLEIKDKGTLTMDDYESIVGNVTGTEENTEGEKMKEGGKIESIKSKKGDIKLSLDETWYSDDTDVELVPVSELVKFREFDRKKTPKYNQDNSRENINHLKFMFIKDGVKSPLIIEYSKKDNAVLLIEGNHRLNSAFDMGMEYLPARVVLKKYDSFSPKKLESAMKVKGVEPNEYGYIKSNLKPSEVGIQGTMPIEYKEGGIIEGRLHSECGDDGCGRKFQVGEGGHIIEAERDEAVIVANAFNDNEKYTITGTPSEIASALNVMGGGKNFDKGATIENSGETLAIPYLEKEASDKDVDNIIDSGSIIINRRSMADENQYKVSGSTKQIASAINSLNGNGVVIEEGATIEKN